MTQHCRTDLLVCLQWYAMRLNACKRNHVSPHSQDQPVMDTLTGSPDIFQTVSSQCTDIVSSFCRLPTNNGILPGQVQLHQSGDSCHFRRSQPWHCQVCQQSQPVLVLCLAVYFHALLLCCCNSMSARKHRDTGTELSMLTGLRDPALMVLGPRRSTHLTMHSTQRC